MRLGVWVSLVGLVTTAAWGLPPPADAPVRVLAQVGPRSEALLKTQRLIDDGEFEAAVSTVDKAIGQEDLSDDQLVEAYRLLGLAHLYLGTEDKARDAFEKLLQARPDYELPKGTPPKIRTLYGRIKDDIKKRRVRPVTLALEPVQAAEANADVELQAHIEDLALGAKPRLFYRRAGAQSFSSTDFVRVKGSRSDFRATVPAFAVPAEETSYEVEYYVEVADAAQRRLAGKGDAYTPLTFTVAALAKSGGGAAAPAPSAWYQNPWLWVGVGVGVAAVTTGAVLVATQQQQATIPIKIQVEGTP